MTDPPEWLTATVDYEGQPLALRVRPSADHESNNERYPHLGLVSHKLGVVRSDGLPETDYNATLSDFDHHVHDLLERQDSGRVLIVETFGGERNYYACVASQRAQEEWIDALSAAHPNLGFASDFRWDDAWRFYRQYREGFKW